MFGLVGRLGRIRIRPTTHTSQISKSPAVAADRRPVRRVPSQSEPLEEQGPLDGRGLCQLRRQGSTNVHRDDALSYFFTRPSLAYDSVSCSLIY